jgi:hypothetical protein
MSEISNLDDLIDSRSVIDRIEELRSAWADSTENDPDDYDLSEDDWRAGLDAEDAAELVALLALQSEGEGYSDWQHGATLIRDSYFEDYARELAEDIGAIPEDASWPAHQVLGTDMWCAGASRPALTEMS